MRKLYQDDEFAKQYADLQQHVPRLDEFMRGLKHKLLTNPEFGTQIQHDPPVWFVGMPDIVAKPIGVSYTFDDDRVVLLSIWIDDS